MKLLVPAPSASQVNLAEERLARLEIQAETEIHLAVRGHEIAGVCFERGKDPGKT